VVFEKKVFFIFLGFATGKYYTTKKSHLTNFVFGCLLYDGEEPWGLQYLNSFLWGKRSMISEEVRDRDYHIIDRLIQQGILEPVNPVQLCAGKAPIYLQCADEKDTNEKDREYLRRADIDTSSGAIACIQALGGGLVLSPLSPMFNGMDPVSIETIIGHYHQQFQLAPRLTGREVRCLRVHYPCRAADNLAIGVMQSLAILCHGISYLNSRNGKPDNGSGNGKLATGFHVHWPEDKMQTWHFRRWPFREIARCKKSIPEFFRDQNEFRATQPFLHT